MAALVKKLERLLRKAFPRPDKIVLEDDKGILGHVVSSRFNGLESMDRIKIIWDLLEENLTEDERRRIVNILAITPLEEKAHAASGGIGYLP